MQKRISELVADLDNAIRLAEAKLADARQAIKCEQSRIDRMKETREKLNVMSWAESDSEVLNMIVKGGA